MSAWLKYSTYLIENRLTCTPGLSTASKGLCFNLGTSGNSLGKDTYGQSSAGATIDERNSCAAELIVTLLLSLAACEVAQIDKKLSAFSSIILV